MSDRLRCERCRGEGGTAGLFTVGERTLCVVCSLDELAEARAEIERLRKIHAVQNAATAAHVAEVAAESMRDRAAKVAELEAERLKHASHVDGLGMGFQAGEEISLSIAAAIRNLPLEEEP